MRRIIALAVVVLALAGCTSFANTTGPGNPVDSLGLNTQPNIPCPGSAITRCVVPTP